MAGNYTVNIVACNKNCVEIPITLEITDPLASSNPALSGVSDGGDGADPPRFKTELKTISLNYTEMLASTILKSS